MDTEGPACFAQVTLIVAPDVVMRASSLDVAYRQRLVESVTGPGLDFRAVLARLGRQHLAGSLNLVRLLDSLIHHEPGRHRRLSFCLESGLKAL